MDEKVDSKVEADAYLRAIQSRGWRCGLGEMEKAVAALGNPQDGVLSVHVAGTNGKGSTCAMISSILQSAGLRVGLFISPHLVEVRERITINGEMIPEKRFYELVLDTKRILEDDRKPAIKLTFFEFLTAVGFRYFSEKKVDILVAEVGLGGRYDATNVLKPSVSIITQIGLDHMEQLGSTIEAIAGEKAGILKKGAGVVSAAADPGAYDVIRKRAFELGSPIIEKDKDFRATEIKTDLNGTSFDYEGTRTLRHLKTNLLGSHQAENAATAVAAVDALAHSSDIEVSEEQIRNGLRNVEWPGRLDVVSRKPLMIVDCAHNPSAIRKAKDSLSALGIRPTTIIFASSRDKDYKLSAAEIFPLASKLVLTRYGNPRSLDPKELAALPDAQGKEVRVAGDVAEAIEIARKITGKDGCILLIGSVFLVGDLLSWLKYGKLADFSLAGLRPFGSPKA